MNSYKTQELLFFVVSAILLAACSKQNNAPTTAPISVVGKWYDTKDTTTYYTTTTNAQESQYIYVYNRTNYMQFNSDNTGIIGIVDVNSNLTTENFTYVISANNEITFNIPAQTVGGNSVVASTYQNTIKTLTVNNLVLYYNSFGLHPGNARYTKEVTYFSK